MSFPLSQLLAEFSCKYLKAEYHLNVEAECRSSSHFYTCLPGALPEAWIGFLLRRSPEAQAFWDSYLPRWFKGTDDEIATEAGLLFDSFHYSIFGEELADSLEKNSQSGAESGSVVMHESEGDLVCDWMKLICEILERPYKIVP
jgi:hypothetical protein